MSDSIEGLDKKLARLEGMIWFQRAFVQAFRIYLVTRIAEVTGKDRTEMLAEIDKITRIIYDENISKLEDSNPSYAALIDLRGDFEKHLQDAWYFPEGDDPPGRNPQRGSQ